MSTDEQMAAIGRMMTERADAKREQACLLHKIQGLAENLNAVGSALRYNLGTENQRRVMPVLEQLIKTGSLEGFAALVENYNSVTIKIGDLEGKLTAAGIQFP
jgi:hypothetical protein